MKDDKQIIYCICMTCGIRNDKDNPSSLCRNGHDDWLEFADVQKKTIWFRTAAKAWKLTHQQLTERFMNPYVTQIP